MKTFQVRILAQTLPFLLIAPAVALAQAPPSRAEASAALHASANPGDVQFTRQQLDQMLAPVALYPDELLSDVLMAATYPQQMLDADQWLQDPQHRDLKGDALAQALDPLPWDPSVKSLVPFPQIVAMMAQHIEWTQALGSAFAEDQTGVMARVQALRQLAMKSGKLNNVHHLKVREEGSEVIITSAEPDRVYVPIYNPTVVYGSAWPDRDYPPVYLPPPQGFVAETIEPGVEVSIGYAVVAPLWGWSRPDWREHRIAIERDRYTRISRNAEVPANNVWVHTGPVTLVAPSEARRSTTATAKMPAGTVAPREAAAPRAVATRSAHGQPNAEQNRATAGQPSQNQPAANANHNEPNRNAATGNEPNRNTATEGPTQKRPTTATQPGQPAGAANEPAKSGTSASNPSGSTTGNASRQEERHPGEAKTTEPGKTGTGSANPSGSATENASRHEQRHPGEMNTNEPGKTGSNAAAPAPQRENAARHQERPADREGTGRPQHANPPAAEEQPGREHAAPGSGSSAEPSRKPREEPNRPNAAQAPAPQPGPQQHQAQQPAPPHQPGPPAQAEHREPAQPPPMQGSSTPPGEAAHQRPQPPAAAHQPGKPDEEQKKEH